MPSTTTLLIDQLCLSPLNVRTYSPDAEDTAGLQASILADGLINPIAVHQMKGGKTKWGAIAGGRRYRAIKALIGNGDLPADYAVRVNVLDGLSDAELIEHSITENLIRRDLREHELYAGVARAAARGHGVEQIAKGIGQPDVGTVSRWLRLGRLAPPIFEAFRAEKISLGQATAFAAVEDQELQRVTFERLTPINPTHPTPADIRKAMKVGDVRAQRELAFVGADAYRAAGGRFDQDLFADVAEERGRIVDEGKLQQLVDDKIAIVRTEIRATTARPDLRFVPDQPKDQWDSVDHQLSVNAKPRAEGGLELPDGDIVAHIEIDATGAPIVSYWWASRKAKFGNEKPAAPIAAIPRTPAPATESPFDAHHRVEATREGDGLTIDGTFAMSAVRKVVLRAALIDDAKDFGTVGLDYLVWAQARALLTTGYRQQRLGIRIIAGDSLVGVSHDALALAREHAAATEAAKIAAKAVLTISQQDFFTDDDLETAFMAYRAASPEIKSLTAATIAGFVLERSLATPELRCAVHDVVASEAGIGTDNFRKYWMPTGDMLDMFPKAQRLAIAEPFVDVPTLAAWAKAKSADLTTGVLTLLTRAGSRGLRWVHPLLRFSVPYAPLPTDDRGAAE